jgi:thymidylate synthase (methanogen type)
MEKMNEKLLSNTIGSAWLNSINAVMKYGSAYHDEDVLVKELLSLAIHVEHPSSEDEFIYKHGDISVIDNMLCKFSKGIVMPDRPFTYGQRIFDYQGIDQFEWLIHRISNKLETKSATITLQVPGDTHPNQPCLSTLDAKIRHGKLHFQFFFRSQNIFGRQYANLIALAKLQEGLAFRLDVTVGSLSGFIASAHIYEYDFEDAEQLCLGNESLRIIDKFYSEGPKTIRDNF